MMRQTSQSTGTDVGDYFTGLCRAWRDSRPRKEELLSADGVVLCGAGVVGRQFAAAMRRAGAPALAFADNDSAKWGSNIDGLEVLPPADAVQKFKNQPLFLLSVGRVGDAIESLRAQYRGLGARRVEHFIPALRRIPELWAEFFLRPDVFDETQKGRCEASFNLFADDVSRRLFLAHLRWRTTIDPTDLRTPDYDNQYFPAGVIVPENCSVFIDVGAFTGDTLAAVVAFAGSSLRAYYGFEPDPKSYLLLRQEAAAVAAAHAEISVTVRQTVLAGHSGTVGFSTDGLATSRRDGQSGVMVPCESLDELGIADPTYLKIDVEGSESEVLDGAIETICQSGPSMAIATYHRPLDLFDLPRRLSDLRPDYRFYLRSHGDAGIDLVCYAVRVPRVTS